MKLPMKVAGICWSLTFLVTATPGFYKHVRPMEIASIGKDVFSGIALLETLALSLLGAFAAGMIGFIIGDILSHPQGKPKTKPKGAASTPQGVGERADGGLKPSEVEKEVPLESEQSPPDLASGEETLSSDKEQG